ncbi:N-fatty-acyl-amino acid synthase/hydrolase PM20D1-like [Pomacea canaliculata]|uniref:N-fatty-acyl-amino acid synthase/hydrolase PM20D1-like n=1 Tax=Pomacea canaliculata TaxID=400727 RepID=UPI000D7320EB|nr:N-fatty-acyl-amino acid synthase/hydrolase PM20D1-like [Pomacea canaliculata]
MPERVAKALIGFGKLFAAVTLILVLVVLIRTWTLKAHTDDVFRCSNISADFIPLTEVRLENFRRSLRFQTVTKDRQVYDRDQLAQLVKFIIQAYPTVHSSPLVAYEVIANYSLLYKVQGSNTSLTPYLLASHLDVVPAPDKGWDAPPFSADILDDFIYARGTIDDKQGVMGILEAVEFLLSNGFKPRRTFYIAFGHDEEGHGVDGAFNIAETLKSQGLTKLEFVSDEGLTIINGLVPGLTRPVGLLGTSEKGQVLLRLRVRGQPGHSSMPPKESTIGILAQAVRRLELNPQPSMFGRGPEHHMFEHLAPKMTQPLRLVMSNLWLFGPIVSWYLSKAPTTNAIIRTVTAVTMFNAGIKNNVIPSEATAVVNHRIHPAQTVQEVIDIDRALIDDDRVEIEVMSSMEPHPQAPSDEDSFGYHVIKDSIREVFPEVVVAPGLMFANTDTRFYLQFTHNVYRFSPTFMQPTDVARVHGLNERISKKNYEQAINFYEHLILHADAPGLLPYHNHDEV